MGMEQQIYEILRPFARMVAEELARMGYGTTHATTTDTPSRQLRGLAGIMEIFHCSRSKASRLKESGVLDEAITRVSGRMFLVDEQKALAAVAKKKGGRNY